MTDKRGKLFEALGTWSVEICRPDAELAPPQYLLDAIDAACAAPATDKRVPPCPFCGGSGKYYTPTRTVAGDGYLEEPCISCNGTGERTTTTTAASDKRQDRYRLLRSGDQAPDVKALIAELDALKAALRQTAITARPLEAGRWLESCQLCDSPEWAMGEPERHTAGCLAAPEDAP